ncbi:MAG TPA: toll/interleukin-1 receptor domain-containing protein [Ktedonobacterales bacterium]|nr:toll/interleukin-1 receptor domain-containing protein [Ktedonobacterales bacterium]
MASNSAARQIFVSHDHTDNTFCFRLVASLREAMGDNVSVDYDSSGGMHDDGPTWQSICRGILGCHSYIVVLSPGAVLSKWVQKEIDLACMRKVADDGFVVIPVLLRPCAVPESLHRFPLLSFLSPATFETILSELLSRLDVTPSPKSPKPVPSIDIGRSAIRAAYDHEFESVGQQVSPRFVLRHGLAIFDISHDGTRHFSVWLMNERGERRSLLVNTRGQFTGSTAIGANAGAHLLNVAADGKWRVGMRQPDSPEFHKAQDTRSFNGNGQTATSLFKLPGGLVIFRMKHVGRRNFIVSLIDHTGHSAQSLANKIGTFDGAKAIQVERSGAYVLEIKADGDWSIVVDQ